jgi:hypothetical protein
VHLPGVRDARLVDEDVIRDHPTDEVEALVLVLDDDVVTAPGLCAVARARI